MLDTFQSHGHTSIDTSRFYGGGTSEEYLAALDWQARSLDIHTKFYPNVHGVFGRPVTHLTPLDMRSGLEESLAALKTESVELWYLHAPDRSVPLEETLKGVHELYQEGKFKNWGISNFMAWEVAAICEICTRNSYRKPSVYQGVYNALHRNVEEELFPCLRKYGIAFYAFNPLAGGYLTDRYHRDTKDAEIEKGSRFDPNELQGKMYRLRYWTEAFFDALDVIRPACKEKGLRESEVALRWMVHHSQLSKEKGDRIIIGASNVAQLEANLTDFEKEQLDEEILRALDAGWKVCKGSASKYFH